jgi:hypothetical protein
MMGHSDDEQRITRVSSPAPEVKGIDFARHPRSDREFLIRLGITPYDPHIFSLDLRERGKTRFLQAVAILQMIAIGALLVWTSR